MWTFHATCIESCSRLLESGAARPASGFLRASSELFTRLPRNDPSTGYRSSVRRCHHVVAHLTFRLIRFMGSLSFPDINVWLALLIEDQVHRPEALAWWRADQSEQVAFSHFTQIGVLRLLTTSAQ